MWQHAIYKLMYLNFSSDDLGGNKDFKYKVARIKKNTATG